MRAFTIIAAALSLAACDPASRLVVDTSAPTYRADPVNFKRDLKHCETILGMGDLTALLTETTVAALGGYAIGHGAGSLAITGVTSAPPALGVAVVVGAVVFVINLNGVERRQADNLAKCLGAWNHVVYAR